MSVIAEGPTLSEKHRNKVMSLGNINKQLFEAIEKPKEEEDAVITQYEKFYTKCILVMK